MRNNNVNFAQASSNLSQVACQRLILSLELCHHQLAVYSHQYLTRWCPSLFFFQIVKGFSSPTEKKRLKHEYFYCSWPSYLK